MSNYTNLKAAIADVIKQNGNQEITGNLLQQVLLNIVSAVGANSAFVGIATPSTVPGSPDGNEFYIAFEPGLYADFGGYTLTNNLTIFINKSGSWVALPTVYNKAYIDTELDKKVSKTGNETIQGVKTFESSPLIPAPESEDAAVPKEYVDNQDATKVSKTGNETINGVKTFQSSPIVPTPTQSTEVAPKGYVDNGLALKVNRAEVDYIRYSDRVALDSGTIRDKVMLKAMYDDALNLLPNTDLWYNLECGIKTRVSGLNTYVSKVYDLSTNNRDAAQTTEASQPYLVSNINPANRLAIWGLSRRLPLSSSVAKITTDKWTLAVNIKALGGLCEFIGSTNTRLSVTTAATDSVTFKNESGTSVSLNLLSKIVGTSARLYFVAKGDGTMQIWLNGVLQGTLSNPTNATFTNLYGSANGELKAIRLFNKDLNKSEIEFLDAKMAAYYPPFEGVVIGNQVWEASNAMDIVAPDGTAIPEVQPNDTASATDLITNAADREFSSDTGFWSKTAQVTIGGGVCNIKSTDGSYQSLSKYNLISVNKMYALRYDVVRNGGGTLAMGGAATNILLDSTIGVGKVVYFLSATTTFEIKRNSICDIDLDNLSLKEAAWSELTTPAWCYYNNSEANGAIYGRQYNNYAVVKLTGSPIWRAPMKADFDQLATFLNGTSVAGGKLKASGLAYWNTPNTGATNESGFTALPDGQRDQNGVWANLRYAQGLWSASEYSSTAAYRFYCHKDNTDIVSDVPDKRRGYALRRLRRVPSGDLVREISSGVFTTNITGGTFKDIAVPNMYKITGVKVTSAQALTNFTLEARTAAGVLVQNLLSGKSIGAGKSIIFSVVADMEVMLQDYIARATAIGNGGAGMEIELIIEKIKV